MATALVTGGSGFLGSLLIARLLADGHDVTSIDLLPGAQRHPLLAAIVGDVRDRALVDGAIARSRPDVVFHCAALLAHGRLKPRDIREVNVEGTRVLAAAAAAARVPHIVYTSSNCLWSQGFDRPVREDDAPAPCEPYGESKLEGERILLGHAGDFTTTILRCPTIMGQGRLGLLAILFEFIAEGRRVWTVGSGANRYQFVDADDLIDAMLLGWRSGRTGVYGVGADEVGTMRDSYEHVIARSGSKARVAALPKAPTLLAMRLAHRLGISPLGPYHYRMIAESFVFDTGRIKAELGWRPRRTNRDMLLAAYRYYHANRVEIGRRQGVSAHRRASAMGVIRLLKWMS